MVDTNEVESHLIERYEIRRRLGNLQLMNAGVKEYFCIYCLLKYTTLLL